MDGVFDVPAAQRLARELDDASYADVRIDLTRVREFHDFGVALLAQSIAGRRAPTAVLGLHEHHLRLLRLPRHRLRRREPERRRRSRRSALPRSNREAPWEPPGAEPSRGRPRARSPRSPRSRGAHPRYHPAGREMQDVLGNTLGLKPSQLHALRRTYRRRVDARSIVSPELARHLCEVSAETNRQIGVLLDRKGDVHSVIVGDARRLELPDVGRAPRGREPAPRAPARPHPPRCPSRSPATTTPTSRSSGSISSRRSRSRPDGLPGKVHYAHLAAREPAGRDVEGRGGADASTTSPTTPLGGALALEEEFARARSLRRTGGAERAILVGFGGRSRGRAEAEASLEELRELARTAGVEVLEATLQLRRDPDPRYLIGKGKLEDIVLRSMQRMATMIVFDAELSPSQARHIAEATSLKILDRTQLILDIFAQRAQSSDGKLQVELAQLRYLYPRLVGRDDSLSRLAGGIGGRGPGETKLEIDRRRVRDRITALERRIEALGESRHLRRKQRNARGLPVLSIVGYTNAGKSTLLNALTDSDGARRGQALRDARPDQPPAPLPARPRGDHHRHRRVHPRPAAGSRERVPRDARGARRRGPPPARRRRVRPAPRRADRARWTRSWAASGSARSAASSS